jgi:hypothetical protein
MKMFLKRISIFIIFLLFSCNNGETITQTGVENVKSGLAVNNYRNMESESEVNKDESDQIEFDLEAYEQNRLDHLWETIEKIKEALVRNDRNTIVKMINYPLNRHYPLPDIINEEEMLEKFDHIFDENQIRRIVESDISDVLEWQGKTYCGLWFSDSTERIFDIHSSSFEEKLREKLIEESKQKIHSSLREFADVCLVFETKNYHIRIDDLGLPDYPFHNYRYTVWPKGTPESEMPDLVLTDGTYNRPGTMLMAYVFSNSDDYIYVIYLEVGGPAGGHLSNSAGLLEVYHTGFKAGGHDISISTWYDFDYYVGDSSRILREEIEIVFGL